MITKIKSLSKRTLSVLLVLLMVISTVTVGIITTTAAYTDEDEAVGDVTLYLSGDFNRWGSGTAPSTEFTLEKGSYEIKLRNGDTWYGVDANQSMSAPSSVSGTSSYNFDNRKSNNMTLNVSVAGTYSFTHSQPDSSGSVSFTLKLVRKSGSSGSHDWYIAYGSNNWATDNQDSKFTLNGSYYEFPITFEDGNNYFRVTDGSSQYNGSGSNSDTILTESTWANINSTAVNNGTFQFNSSGGGAYTIQIDASTSKVRVVPATKTVTYDYATGSSSSMGTISVTKKSGSSDVSIGASQATVANGEAVTFTATPVFGYHFVGWYTDDAGTTLNTTINASENDGSDIGVISTNPAISVTSNITAYAKFAPNTSDGYYLSGRFATATSAANIHSNTTGKNGVDMYGTLTDDGDGLDEVTSSTNPSAYWTFNQYSTNLPFTSAGGNKYKLETHRTVKQLSEDKAKLLEDYGGTVDNYHGAFLFLVHNKQNRFVADDTAAAAAFHDKDAESKAIDLVTITSSQSLSDSVELRFNDYSSLSNGQVVIWLDVSGYDSSTGKGAKIWYEIADETAPVADSVTLTASPTRVAKGNTVKLNAALSNANASAGTIYYDFYRSTSQNQQWEKISTDDNTSNVLNYTENSSSGTVYYHVVARSGNTTTSSSGNSSMPFNVRSDSTSVDTYTAGVFVTESNIKDLALDGTPTWSDDQKDKVTSGEIYSFGTSSSTSSSITNSAPFVFTVASEEAWDPDYPKMDIDADSNQFCTISYGTKRFQKTVDGETQTVVVRTYVVTPNPKCTNPTIYFDFKNNKVWAVAEVGTFTKEQTATLGDKGETVTYYFAERIENSDDQKSDPEIVPSDHKGVKITYWNNSLDKNGYKDVTTPANGPTNDNIIYVKPDAFAHNGSSDGGYSYSNAYSQFRVYKVDLPIWATSFKFTASDGADFDAVPTGKDGTQSYLWRNGTTNQDVYSARTSKNHSITLNPNRIYCLFKGGDYWRIGGVVLDDSMYYQSTAPDNHGRLSDGNEIKTFKVDSNLVDYTDTTTEYNPSIDYGSAYNDTYEVTGETKTLGHPQGSGSPFGLNKSLSDMFGSKSSTHALYFGLFTYDSGDQPNYNLWSKSQAYWGFGKSNNNGPKVMEQNGSGRDWAKNLAQRGDLDSSGNGRALYAATQGLVNMTLTNPNKSGAVLDTDKNKNGFGLLRDASTALSDGKSTAGKMPLFDYSYLKTNFNVATVVEEGLKFPFYESTYKGITTYSYDSTTDRNRLYNSTNKTLDIQSTSTDNGFAAGFEKSTTGGKKIGFFPFGGSGTTINQHMGYGIEFDMNFYMTNTGYLVDEDNNKQDIAFNFSGDDDVWVFIDGVKVLDLGGMHKVSAGTINFTDMMVYYKSSANDINSVGTVFDPWAYNQSSYVNAVSLTDIMAAYGKPFVKTDASTKHTFQMFYMERGSLESNCVISFNLPQATGLNVVNTVKATNVNPALQESALYSVASDYFTYSVDAKLVNGDLPSALTGAYSGLKTPATSGNYTQSLNFSTPKYPYNHQTTRVYTPNWASDYPLVFQGDPLSYLLSHSDTSTGGSGATLTYDDKSWTRVHDTVYTLSESGNASLSAAESSYVAVTGKTGSGTDGLFHLLSGEKATFDNKVPMNAYVKVTQSQKLGGAVPDTSNHNVIKYDDSEGYSNIGNYYTTSYSVYDEKSKKYIVEDTPYSIRYADDQDYEAVDSRTGSDNGFYFSNYTGDVDDINSAMTVEFTNEVAVGTLRVQKQLKDQSTSKAKFTFRVKLGRIFGTTDPDMDTLEEIPNLEYRVYNSSGEPTTSSESFYDTSKGIVLLAGEYAEIRGIPVETRFEIEEVVAPGYTFDNITKTAVKPNNDAVINARSRKPYSETINSPSAPKTSSDTLSFDGDFKYYVNMIPLVSESFVNDATGYTSISTAVFTNARETYDVYFCYYDRETDDTIQGKPAAISNKVTRYKTEVKNLDEFIVFKNEANADKFKSMPNYGNVDTDAFVAFDYAKMIQAQAVEFVAETGTGITNLIDNYRMWTSQKDAVAGMADITNLKTGEKYSGDNLIYHTDSTGQLMTAGERQKWVSYYDNSTTPAELDPEYDTTTFKAGAKDEFEKIKKIYVWLFNEPRPYTFSVYGAANENDLTPVTDGRTFVNSVGNTTLTNVAVAKKVSSEEVNEEGPNGYYNIKGYYSQRTGDKKNDQYLDDIAYLKAYGVDSCVNIGTTSEVNYVRPEKKTEMVIGDRKFAYWSYDSEGKTVASTEYIFGNRITGDFELYAVYANDPMPRDGQTYGLTIHQDADDVYVDSNGVPMIRINAMFNPYNLEDFDPKIKDAVLVNVYVTKLINDGWTKAKIEQLQVTYADQLKALLYGRHNTMFNSSITDSLDLVLTTKGYVYATAGSEITNKNRLELTTYFKKSVLYPHPEDPNYKAGILQIAAMGYDADNNGTVENGEWVLSDNSILRVFTTGEYTV